MQVCTCLKRWACIYKEPENTAVLINNDSYDHACREPHQHPGGQEQPAFLVPGHTLPQRLRDHQEPVDQADLSHNSSCFVGITRILCLETAITSATF